MEPRLFILFFFLLSLCSAPQPTYFAVIPPNCHLHALPFLALASPVLVNSLTNLFTEIHNISSITAAISATNWCQEYEPSAFDALLISLWQCEYWPCCCPTLTFCVCSASKIPQMVSSHDAYHLASKRQGEGGECVQKDITELRMYPIIKTKEDRVSRTQWSKEKNAPEKSMEGK